MWGGRESPEGEPLPGTSLAPPGSGWGEDTPRLLGKEQTGGGQKGGGGFSSLSPQGERGAFHSVLKSKPSGLTPPLCSTWPRARAGGFQNVG